MSAVSAVNAVTSSGEEEDNYLSLSRSAVFGLVLGILALLGIWFPPLVALCFMGLIASGIALYQLAKYPAELTGKPLAIVALLLNATLCIVIPIYHAYVYATELPPGYKRVSFSTLKSPLGQEDVPPKDALELNGQKVFIKGYAHPTSMSAGSVKHFILVPDIATCCFGGQPPLTHMIEISLKGDKSITPGFYRKLRLAGTLRVDSQLKPISGLQGVYYQLHVDEVVQ